MISGFQLLSLLRRLLRWEALDAVECRLRERSYENVRPRNITFTNHSSWIRQRWLPATPRPSKYVQRFSRSDRPCRFQALWYVPWWTVAIPRLQSRTKKIATQNQQHIQRKPYISGSKDSAMLEFNWWLKPVPYLQWCEHGPRSCGDAPRFHLHSAASITSRWCTSKSQGRRFPLQLQWTTSFPATATKKLIANLNEETKHIVLYPNRGSQRHGRNTWGTLFSLGKSIRPNYATLKLICHSSNTCQSLHNSFITVRLQVPPWESPNHT